MARRKKEVYTPAQQLEAVEREIADCKEKIKELDKKKKEIAKQIAEEEKEALYNAVIKSGMGIEECVALLNEHAKAEETSE